MGFFYFSSLMASVGHPSSACFVCVVSLFVSSQERCPNGINKKIWEKVINTPLIDTHEHLLNESTRLREGAKPFYLTNDFTILFGWYFNHDMMSSGMTQDEYDKFFSKELTPQQKWKIIEPHWNNIKHTSFGKANRYTIKLLYDIDELNENTVVELQKRFEALQKPGFYNYILKDVANIESCQVNPIWQDSTFILTIPFVESDNDELLKRDIGILGMYSHKEFTSEKMNKLSQPANIDVNNLDDWYLVINFKKRRIFLGK